jgi:hypothetical protein
MASIGDREQPQRARPVEPRRGAEDADQEAAGHAGDREHQRDRDAVEQRWPVGQDVAELKLIGHALASPGATHGLGCEPSPASSDRAFPDPHDTLA